MVNTVSQSSALSLLWIIAASLTEFNLQVSSLSPNSAKTNGGGATAPPVDSRVEGVDGHYK